METNFAFDCVKKLEELEKEYSNLKSNLKYQIKSTIDICEKLGKRYDKAEDKLNNFLKCEQKKIDDFREKFSECEQIKQICDKMEENIKSSEEWQKKCKSKISEFNSSSNELVNELTEKLKETNVEDERQKLIKKCIDKINKLTTGFNIDKIIRANKKIEQNKTLDEMIKKFNKENVDNRIDNVNFEYGRRSPKAVPKLNLLKTKKIIINTPFGEAKAEVKINDDYPKSHPFYNTRQCISYENDYIIEGKGLTSYIICCQLLDELNSYTKMEIASKMLEYVQSKPEDLYLDETKKEIIWKGKKLDRKTDKELDDKYKDDAKYEKAAANLCCFIVFCEPFETRSMTGCRLGKESFKMMKKLFELAKKEEEKGSKKTFNLFTSIFCGKSLIYVPAEVASDDSERLGGQAAMKQIVNLGNEKEVPFKLLIKNTNFSDNPEGYINNKIKFLGKKRFSAEFEFELNKDTDNEKKCTILSNAKFSTKLAENNIKKPPKDDCGLCEKIKQSNNIKNRANTKDKLLNLIKKQLAEVGKNKLTITMQINPNDIKIDDVKYIKFDSDKIKQNFSDLIKDYNSLNSLEEKVSKNKDVTINLEELPKFMKDELNINKERINALMNHILLEDLEKTS